MSVHTGIQKKKQTANSGAVNPWHSTCCTNVQFTGEKKKNADEETCRCYWMLLKDEGDRYSLMGQTSARFVPALMFTSCPEQPCEPCEQPSN